MAHHKPSPPPPRSGTSSPAARLPSRPPPAGVQPCHHQAPSHASSCPAVRPMSTPRRRGEGGLSGKPTPPIRRARVLHAFLALLNEHRDAMAAMITAEHGKVLRPTRRARSPRHRDRRVRLRHPAAAQGDFSDNGHRHRQLDAASRSAWSPGSRRSTSRAWSRCGCFRSRSPAGTHSCSSPASATRRPSLFAADPFSSRPGRPGVQRRPGRRGRGRSLLAHPDVGRVLRRLDADRQLHLRDRHRRQARAGARRREEPHDRDARRRRRQTAVDASSARAYGSAGERCMAISVAGARRRHRRHHRRAPRSPSGRAR